MIICEINNSSIYQITFSFYAQSACSQGGLLYAFDIKQRRFSSHWLLCCWNDYSFAKYLTWDTKLRQIFDLTLFARYILINIIGWVNIEITWFWSILAELTWRTIFLKWSVCKIWQYNFSCLVYIIDCIDVASKWHKYRTKDREWEKKKEKKDNNLIMRIVQILHHFLTRYGQCGLNLNVLNESNSSSPE